MDTYNYMSIYKRVYIKLYEYLCIHRNYLILTIICVGIILFEYYHKIEIVQV